MNLYNLYYKADNEVIVKKNITKEEIDIFLNNMTKHFDNELKITKVIKNREKEEEEER